MMDSTCACEECGEDLAPEGALCYDGALLSCVDCHLEHQVSADSEGMHLVAIEESGHE